MSIYSSGRDEEYFPDADKFRPERWQRLSNDSTSDGKNLVLDPFASLPFGHGRRACIGRRLAEVQSYILLNKVITLYINYC